MRAAIAAAASESLVLVAGHELQRVLQADRARRCRVIGELLCTDDMARITALLRAKKLRIDPQFRGELAHLAADPRVRRSYFARRGMTIDAAGEAIWDAGFTHRRPSCNEVLELLANLLTAGRSRLAKVKCAKNRTFLADVESRAAKARKTRLRKYACPHEGCGQIVRGTRATLVLCGVCYEMRGVVVMMERVDPTPEEVLAETLRVA